MLRRLSTPVAMATVATVAALGAVLAPIPVQAADKPPAPAWGACPPPPPWVTRDPRLRCATLRVPLDYRRPGGRKIDIAISRITTAKPGLRRGVLLFNPGGPGGPGLDMPGQFGPGLPADVTDRFDLIGFDPRGVGHSTPVTCGIPDQSFDLQIPYPAPDGSIGRNITFARETADGCARLSGDLLPFITTANTARDMDRIRSALGERKLSYFGLSYGTYLGAVYTSLFPQHSDRILLDSAVDPKLVWYDQWRMWGPGAALRLPDFTTWVAERDATYHLGATPEAVEKTYYDLAARLDKNPLPGEGLDLTGNLFRLITFDRLYYDFRFPELAGVWQSVASTTAPASSLSNLRGSRRLAAPQVPADNLRSAQYAVLCDDVAWPRDLDMYANNVAIDRRLYPATAGMPSNVWPCAFWKYRPVEPPVKVTDKGPRNVLILQNLRDPATPWAAGYGLRQALGQRASFVSVDQGGHGVYLLTASSCAYQTASAFLASGELPASDKLCAGQSPPGVSAQTPPPAVVVPGPLG